MRLRTILLPLLALSALPAAAATLTIADLITAAQEIADIKGRTGRDAPTVIT